MRFREQVAERRVLPALGVILVVGLTLLSGVIHGRTSDRWGPGQGVLAATAELQGLPSAFGQWELRATERLDPSVLAVLKNPGYVLNEYVHTETGKTVKVCVLVGRPGPISVHVPEICYSSSGYSMLSETTRVAIRNGAAEDEFRAITFRANNVDASLIRVLYAWSVGDSWITPEERRFAFAGYPFLYKIQLAACLPPGADVETDDPCEKFLEDFLSVARGHLAKAG